MAASSQRGAMMKSSEGTEESAQALQEEVERDRLPAGAGQVYEAKGNMRCEVSNTLDISMNRIQIHPTLLGISGLCGH